MGCPEVPLDCRVGTASLLVMTGEKEGLPRNDRVGTGWAWDSLGKDEWKGSCFKVPESMERQLTRCTCIGNRICLVNRVFSNAFLIAVVLVLAGCSGTRLDPDLCRNCQGDACRLACGVCAGEGQRFVREKLETCVWCHGSGRRWERVPVRRVEKQSDGTEKVVTRWVTRRVWCSHCGGRGSWRKRVFEPCEPCKGSGAGEYPFVCAVCEGTGERTKGKRPERNWVEAP